jgi:hypothetical protein
VPVTETVSRVVTAAWLGARVVDVVAADDVDDEAAGKSGVAGCAQPAAGSTAPPIRLAVARRIANVQALGDTGTGEESDELLEESSRRPDVRGM